MHYTNRARDDYGYFESNALIVQDKKESVGQGQRGIRL